MSKIEIINKKIVWKLVWKIQVCFPKCYPNSYSYAVFHFEIPTQKLLIGIFVGGSYPHSVFHVTFFLLWITGTMLNSIVDNLRTQTKLLLLYSSITDFCYIYFDIFFFYFVANPQLKSVHNWATSGKVNQSSSGD